MVERTGRRTEFSMVHEHRIPGSAWDFRDCTRDETIEVSEDGRKACLAETVLLADETGRGAPLTMGGEELARFAWAKKEFLLEDIRLNWARLIFYVYEYPGNTSPLYVDINGHTRSVNPGDQDSCGCYIWRILNVPLQFLRRGVNAFVFRSDSSAFNSWILGLEGGTVTGRSAKSTTEGRSWRNELMGFADAVGGEYLVRLQLGRYASQGAVVSPVIDLAETLTGIAELSEYENLKIDGAVKKPEGTSVTLRYRTGGSPFDLEGWSPWRRIASDPQERSVERFIQWQATLSTSQPLLTPELEAVRVQAQRKPVGSTGGQVTIERRDDANLTSSSFPFLYQRSDEPKLALLRQGERLDEIVAEAESEFEKFLKLREWVAQQWPYHGGYPYPPWDALVILDWLRGTRPGAHGGCMHYAVVFCQCCLSLGLSARLVLVEPFPNIRGDGHFATEIWSNDYRKWVYMDPTTNSHFEVGGVPQNMLEIRGLWEAGRTDEVSQVSGHALADDVLGLDYPLEHLRRGGWQHAGLVLRNDHLTSLIPGPLEHGSTAYRWTGFLWWGRHVPQEQPQFPLYSYRWEDFYWPVNQVSIDLQRTQEPDCLTVALGSSAPNLDSIEVRFDGSDWTPSTSAFSWNLKEGANCLQARERNKFGIAGPSSSVVTIYQPS